MAGTGLGDGEEKETGDAWALGSAYTLSTQRVETDYSSEPSGKSFFSRSLVHLSFYGVLYAGFSQWSRADSPPHPVGPCPERRTPLEPPGLTTSFPGGRHRGSYTYGLAKQGSATYVGQSLGWFQPSSRGEEHQQRRQSGFCQGKDTGSSAEELIVEEYTYGVAAGAATYGHPA
ncbi:unnamed protein product [Leuciscus chuanchicus]